MPHRAVGRLRKILLFAATLALVLQGPAAALNPDRSIGQYKLTRWTPDNGAPASISTMAQDADGFLWLATRTGLYRFDGISFEHIPARLPGNVPQANMSLLIARNGDVWTWYRYANRFAVYRKGNLHLLPPNPENGFMMYLVETPDGAVWAGNANPGSSLLRFQGGRWQAFGPDQGVPRDYLLRLILHPDGSVWASYMNSTVRLAPGKARFETVLSTPGGQGGPIVLDSKARIWMSTAAGTYALTDPQGRLVPSPGSLKLAAGYPQRNQQLHFDRAGNLWMNNFVWGLLRIRPPLAGVRGNPNAIPSESFTAKDGLTSDLINKIFEDREGNLWLAGVSGMNQLSDVDVASVPELKRPGSHGDIVRSSRDGTVYIAEQDALYRVDPGGAVRRWFAYQGNPRTLCVGGDGATVLITDEKILRVAADGSSVAIPAPPGAVLRGTGSCAIDSGGSLWISTLGTVWVRSHGSNWRVATPPSDGQDGAHVLADPNGGVFVVRSLTGVDHLDDDLNRRTVMKADDRVGQIVSLFPTRKGVVVRATNGLARFGPDGIHYLSYDRAPGFFDANGLAEQPDGTIWVFSPTGIVRLRSADLDRAFRSPNYSVPTRVFDYRDGLAMPGTAFQVQTVAAGGDGRVWFATDASVMMVDARRLTANRIRPGVKITALVADGKHTRDPGTAELAAGTQDLQISFSAISLTKPQKIEVRYRLEGYDKEWVDPGLRRQAFYSNLRPGTYRFRVIAMNNDGVWNREGATLEFSMPPTFLQSIWFKLLIALAVIGLATLAYQLRLRQVTGRLEARFDARVGERERIARELHDTLLQGVQGLMLRFQAVASRISAPEIRESLDDALDRADAVLVEGRARVRDLRGTSETGELAQRLLTAAATLIGVEKPRVELDVDGEQRPLHPLVLEEAVRIGEEAIRNVLNHAEASVLQISVTYGRRDLILRIRDDGKGIPEAILSSGTREGHFGLIGMRERARQIGGRLEIVGSPTEGTEVVLTVPSSAAYSDRRFSLVRLLRLDKLWRRTWRPW